MQSATTKSTRDSVIAEHNSVISDRVGNSTQGQREIGGNADGLPAVGAHIAASRFTGVRECTKCAQIKAIADFQWRRTRAGAAQGHCYCCESKRVAEYRKRPDWKAAVSSRWNASNPQKRRAHKIVENAIVSGRLIRRPCEQCGTSVGVHAHHEDYSNPLDVNWLCPMHHRERHRELRAEARNSSVDTAAIRNET